MIFALCLIEHPFVSAKTVLETHFFMNFAQAWLNPSRGEHKLKNESYIVKK